MAKKLSWKQALLALTPVGLVVFLSFVGAHKTLDDPEAGPSKGKREGAGELVATSRACQTFVAQYDGLTRVEVLLNDLGRVNSSPFHFYLRTAPDADEDLVSLTRSASEVRGTTYHAFDFAPLDESAGQAYSFCLEAPEAGLENSITVIGTLQDTYPDGQAVFRDMWGQKVGIQDLDFHLAYRLPLGKKLIVLSERMAANKSFLCGAGWFYAVLGIIYLLLLYALFLGFTPAREREG
jgi:hypothetical protein